MSRIFIALILLALGAYCASLALDDYHDGKAQLVLQRYTPITLIFDRAADAAFFWSVTAANIGVIAFFLITGVAMIAASLMGVA